MKSEPVRFVRHNWESESGVTTTLIDALEEVLGQKALLELPPLYDHVDPDALDRLFSQVKSSDRTRGVLYFDFAEYEVAIHATGDVVIYADGPTDDSMNSCDVTRSRPQ